jgi:hypothetical protein
MNVSTSSAGLFIGVALGFNLWLIIGGAMAVASHLYLMNSLRLPPLTGLYLLALAAAHVQAGIWNRRVLAHRAEDAPLWGWAFWIANGVVLLAPVAGILVWVALESGAVVPMDIVLLVLFTLPSVLAVYTVAQGRVPADRGSARVRFSRSSGRFSG